MLSSLLAIALEIIVGLALKYSISSITLFAVATELVFLFTIQIDNLVLRRQSRIATYRRLAAISILSNLMWLALGVLASMTKIFVNDEPRFVALFVVGMFFAISFRAFVFGSVFYGETFYSLPISIVQPILLAFPILELKNVFVPSLPVILAFSLGVIYLISIELYLHFINSSLPIAGSRPLQLLQAFLSAWTLEDPGKMEEIFDRASKESEASTELLRVGSPKKSALIVVPGIHPGPFFPVGSSNLPGEIYLSLGTGETLPLTVHSISDHELNLPSKQEVAKYISSLKEPEKIEEGRSMTFPVIRTQEKATATGIAFGSTCVIMLTQAPYGMEDFPATVRNEIESYSKNAGFKLCLVVDTHNSEGPKPSEAECKRIVDVAREVIDELKSAKRELFSIGLAHTSEIGGELPKDVGPGGIGLIEFRNHSGSYCIAVADANNAKIGFREQVFSEFERSTGAKILELCTSDTHVTAARTLSAKGYLALGDLISVENLTSILKQLYEKAKQETSAGEYAAMHVQSKVKTIGGELLNSFSSTMDKTSNTAKSGAKVLVAFGVVIALIAML